MSTTHFSGPVDSKQGFKVNKNPLIAVAGNAATNMRIVCGSASVKNGSTINTGLSSVSAIFLTATTAGHIATGTVSGGTVTVGLQDNSGNAVNTNETVYWLAVGV